MTYRLPRTLPYLSALLSAAILLGLFLAPNPRAPIAPAGYVLVVAFALVVLACGVLSQRYAVTIAADRLVITGTHRREYLFADMAKLEVLPGGKGVLVAVVTMKDGTRVNVSGSLRDFAGFVRTLGDSARLLVTASNNRSRDP
jgi:hypothetical protein